MKSAIILILLVLIGGCTMSEEDNKTTEPVPDETTEPETTEQPEETEQEDIPPAAGDTLEPTTVLLKTNHGDIKIKLHEDMPITAGNFKKLVEEGFYDGLIFHRVIDGFMIQGGDPDGRGTGGPGYSIQDEFTDHNKNNRGTLSMANSGPNTGGSQFFINLVDNNYLDPKHPVFGEVIEGMDVVDVIAKVPKGAGDRPVEAVTIIEAKII